jgi:hypothetical protein
MIFARLTELRDEFVIHLFRFAAQSCVSIEDPCHQPSAGIEGEVLYSIVVRKRSRLPARGCPGFHHKQGHAAAVLHCVIQKRTQYVALSGCGMDGTYRLEQVLECIVIRRWIGPFQMRNHVFSDPADQFITELRKVLFKGTGDRLRDKLFDSAFFRHGQRGPSPSFDVEAF